MVRTHLALREGGADLFGFATETEREIFLSLVGVSGIGPRSALSVLSAMGPGGVLAGVASGDAAAFAKVPGIGKKLAQRIVNELPDRLKKASLEPEAAGTAVAPATAEAEAAEALVALGYSRSEAQVVAAQVAKEMAPGTPAEAMVREALRRLAKAAR